MIDYLEVVEVTAEVPRPQQVKAETQDRGATADLEAEAEDVADSRKMTRAAVDEVTEDADRDSEVKTDTVLIQEITETTTDGKDGIRKLL